MSHSEAIAIFSEVKHYSLLKYMWGNYAEDNVLLMWVLKHTGNTPETNFGILCDMKVCNFFYCYTDAQS